MLTIKNITYPYAKIYCLSSNTDKTVTLSHNPTAENSRQVAIQQFSNNVNVFSSLLNGCSK